MATAQASADTALSGPRTPAAAIKVVGRMVAAQWRWLVDYVSRIRRARKTYRELSRLSDRELNDIGLLRAEIGPVADALAAEPARSRLAIPELRRR